MAAVIYYTSQPFTWLVSRTWYSPSSAPLPPHCAPIRKGVEPYIDQTKAKTIDSAFDVLGFGWTSQTGYTTNASITFWFGENGLCGDKKYPEQGFNWPMAIP